jgi:5-methylcytosine-specific restriction endonuclease McrA
LRIQQAEYNKANPAIRQACHARRRAREMQAPVRDFTAQQWVMMKNLSDHRCVYCGRKMQRLTMDHIIPLVHGGAHTWSNIVPACKSCNSSKRDRAPLCPIQPLLPILQ